MKKIFFVIIGIVGLFTSCKKSESADGNSVINLKIPKGFPYPTIPSDNQITANRVALGRKLFFDPILSRDSTISCSSCHHNDFFYIDTFPVSKGVSGRLGTRNAISLINVAWQQSMFWDGGVPTLEEQVLAPIEAHNEMDYDENLVVTRLLNSKEYVSLVQKAYNKAPSVYTLTRAIACFERTLVGTHSKFDDYQYYGDTNALSASEKNGMNIFFGEKGECFHCHNEYNFTTNDYRNNGIYLQYSDSGRARITLLSSDVGKFKVPSLRNVAMTAPYMHNGGFASLEQVVDHYNSGGQNNPNKDPLIRPLNLSNAEKTDLINFLKALTDQ